MKILIDSNILVYSVLTNSEYHTKSRDVLKNIESLFISHQNLLETYRAITSIKSNGSEIVDPIEASEIIEIFSTNMNLIFPTKETFAVLKNLISKYKVSSYAIYDANIVATMLTYGIDCIYTNNEKDFQKYKEITVVNPFVLN